MVAGRGPAPGDAATAEDRVVIYPGMAHTMNLAPKFTDELGDPDQRVVAEAQGWLKAHRAQSAPRAARPQRRLRWPRLRRPHISRRPSNLNLS